MPVDVFIKDMLMRDADKFRLSLNYYERAISEQEFRLMLQKNEIDECFLVHKKEMFNVKEVQAITLRGEKFRIMAEFSLARSLQAYMKSFFVKI